MCNILILFVVLVYFLCVPKYLSIIIIIWLITSVCFLLANSNASGNAVQYEDILKSDHAGFLLNFLFLKDYFSVLCKRRKEENIFLLLQTPNLTWLREFSETLHFFISSITSCKRLFVNNYTLTHTHTHTYNYIYLKAKIIRSHMIYFAIRF